LSGLFAAVFGRVLGRWRGAVAAAGMEDFRALLPIGIDFETLETPQADPRLTPVTALLLTESGFAPANPPE